MPDPEIYQSIFQRASDALAVVDADRRVLDCNAAFTALFGHGASDVVDSTLPALVPDADPVVEIAVAVERLRTLIRADGTTFRGRLNIIEIPCDHEGDGVFLIAARAVPGEPHSPAEIDDGEIRYRDLVLEAPVGIVRSTAAGKLLFANGTFAEMLGYPTAEALREEIDSMESIYHDPADRDRFSERLATDGQLRAFVFRAVHRAGEEVWLEATARTLVDAEGAAIFAGFARDVTARVVASRSAERLRKMLQRTERLARIGSWEYEVDTGKITWSEEMYRILGIPPDEEPPALDAHREHFTSESMDRVETAIRGAIETGEPYRIDLEAKRRGEGTLEVTSQGYPEFDGEGRVVRIVGFLQDMSEIRQMEETRRELQRQLAQAQKMESIGRLAGGIAHDFNNMLSVIIGNAELALSEMSDGAEWRAELVEIHEAAERSSHLIEQLLAFAREQTREPRVLDPNSTVERTIRMLARLVREEIEMVFLPGEVEGNIVIDPTQLDQVLTNLVLNAQDAIRGSGRIEIGISEREVDGGAPPEITPTPNPGPYLVITVTDTGSGMDPDVLRRIFDPFFTTRAPGEGSGLGLATVFGILQQNGGFVTVESEVGRGSTFAVHLPRTDREVDPPRSEIAAGPIEGTEAILLVEDEPSWHRGSARSDRR